MNTNRAVVLGMAIGVIAVFAGGVVFGQARQDALRKLRLGELTIVDSEGRDRITLTTEESGPVIRLLSEAGESAVTIQSIETADGAKPFVVLWRGGGEVATHIGKDGVTIQDDSGEMRASMSVTPEGASLILIDSDGGFHFSEIAE